MLFIGKPKGRSRMISSVCECLCLRLCVTVRVCVHVRARVHVCMFESRVFIEN